MVEVETCILSALLLISTNIIEERTAIRPAMAYRVECWLTKIQHMYKVNVVKDKNGEMNVL